MGLRPDRNVHDVDISYFMDEVAERGGVVVGLTAGSGAAMDQSEAAVTYTANPSGNTAVGLLLSEVRNLDLTRQHRNWHQEEVQKGGKVTLMTRGWATTNRLEPADTPTAFQTAYVGNSGLISNTDKGKTASPAVGTFLSTKDSDGYVKVAINLPQVRD